MIHFVVTRVKRRVVEEYLGHWGKPLTDRFRIVDYEELATLRTIPRGTWVLSDLDALGPAGTELVTGLHDVLTAEGMRVLNDPRRTLGRLEILEALHANGINDFRAVPATGDWRSLRFPVFVRGESDHLGAVGGILDTPEAVQETLDRAAKLGLSADHLIVVEFLDTAGPDGMYRKHGTYVVGDRVITQHVLWSDHWMIKQRTGVFTAEYAREELSLVRSNAFADIARRCFDIAGTGYGRMDFSVGPDGRVQVWEINLSPIIGRPPGPSRDPTRRELGPLRHPRREIFYDRFQQAWKAVDTAGTPGPDIVFEPGRAVRDRTVEELTPPSGPEAALDLLRAKAYFRNW